MKKNLIEDNMRLVYFLINKYYPTFTNDEDIVQSGMLGLCRAAETWNEEKSVFSTYASKCILNEIKKELRERKKHNGVLSLDYSQLDENGESNTFGDSIMGDEDVSYFGYDSFLDSLSPLDQAIIKYKQVGLTTAEIAKRLDCNKQTVNQHLRLLEHKWRKLDGH